MMKTKKKGIVSIEGCAAQSFDLNNLEILEHKEDDLQVGLEVDVAFKMLRITEMKKKNLIFIDK